MKIPKNYRSKADSEKAVPNKHSKAEHISIKLKEMRSEQSIMQTIVQAAVEAAKAPVNRQEQHNQCQEPVIQCENN